MQDILSKVRRCVQDYGMIGPGDGVAAGLSGGKDSLLLVQALALLRGFYPVPYTLRAITIDNGIPGADFTPLADFCAALEVPHHIVKTDIAEVVFDIRQESNPCALCAKMRRGALHAAAVERGCRVVALGHHCDDAVATALMNLLYEGRFASFAPKTYLDRRDVTVIRPLLYVEEKDIAPYARRLPVMASPCPVNGQTKRQEAGALLRSLREKYPEIKQRIFHALQGTPGWAREK